MLMTNGHVGSSLCKVWNGGWLPTGLEGGMAQEGEGGEDHWGEE